MAVFRPVLSASLIISLMLSGALVTIPRQPALAATSLATMPQNFSPNLVADIAEMVAPSVVNIDTERKTNVQIPEIPFNDEMMKRFFGFDPGELFGPFRNMPKTMTGNGSGVIMDNHGHILTNNHVVAGADKITVTLNDGRQFAGRIVGRDPFTDIAVVKIDAPNLKPIAIGNSEALRPGEWVIAVGSPLGFDHTVTLGIVSALSRKIPDINANLKFIQTDAAINPGNSGGPLVNIKGEMVGINTAIMGSGQNIGFAIPINEVRQIASDLMAGKTIERPWIGLSMAELNPDLAKHVGLPPETKGVVIAQVLPNSPAYKAGLMQGDVIQKVDEKPVTKAEVVQETVRSKPVKSKITLDILRNGHPIEVSLTSEPLPQSTEEAAPFEPRVRPLP